MGNQSSYDVLATQPCVEALPSRGSHIIFFDPSATDGEQRLQEVLLINPTIDFIVHPLCSRDAVGQVSEVMSLMIPHSVRSLWIISGSEVPQSDSRSEAEKRVSRLDSRISQWQAAFAADTTCYLLGDDLVDLADQLDRMTGARIERDFDAAPPAHFEEVIFVDHAALNFENFVKDLLLERDANIVMLDPMSDGLQQIAQYLHGRKEIKAIHLICPGSNCSLVLGQTILGQSNLSGICQSTLREIGRALAKDSEIRIYNDQFNARNCGTSTIRELSSAINAFVIVANAEAKKLMFDLEFQNRFQSSSNGKREILDWDSLLPPMNDVPISGPKTGSLDRAVSGDADLIWNQDKTELVIRSSCDRVQAIAWACVGFAAGGGSISILFGFGYL